ncbi:MAG: hypothetical protein ACRDY7_14600, partial [Acidimicrobiia bacterium]
AGPGRPGRAGGPLLPGVGEGDRAVVEGTVLEDEAPVVDGGSAAVAAVLASVAPRDRARSAPTSPDGAPAEQAMLATATRTAAPHDAWLLIAVAI